MSETILRSPEKLIHRWPTAHAREWLSSFLAQARCNRNVIAVVAIGSAVRSRVASDDLDLFVICRDSKQLRAELLSRLICVPRISLVSTRTFV